MNKEKIDPKVWYSLTDISVGEFFPWLGRDPRSYRRLIDSDRKGKNRLKAVIMGVGRLKRYQILGKNIISFKAKAESGKVNL